MIKKVYRTIKNFLVSTSTKLSPRLGTEVLYFLSMRKKINLKNPKSFNEKLMWLKLKKYNDNPVIWQCVDKYLVRDYLISKGISQDVLVPLVGVYNNVNEINWQRLPKKFALKCTHGSGFNIISHDKSKLDEIEVKRKLERWQHTKFGLNTAETHYNHNFPKIICEEFIEGKIHKLPNDYKFYCFHGIPQVVLVCSDRDNNFREDFFDMDWNMLLLRNNGMETPNAETVIKKPSCFDEMVDMAKILSKDFEFVRVDFYDNDGKVIFGEMTFTPASCMAYYNKFGDKYLSKLLKLETKIGSDKK